MMNLSLEKAREDLIIDKCDLDGEVSEQSITANHIGEKLVEAESRRDEAKENVATVDATVSIVFRKEAEAKNEKITEAKLKELVITSEDHANAMNEYLNLKEEASHWKILREDFISRGYMVSKLCDLYASDYYSKDSQ
jgi:3-deoxy-D-manno-octulosonate 8-phosphate phosphatase KdsC-like HAD superfamily phosphatase